MIVLKVIYYLFPIIFIVGNILMMVSSRKMLDFTKEVNENSKKDELDKDESLVGKSCLLLGYVLTAMAWGISVIFTYNYEFAILFVPTMWILSRLFFSSKKGSTFGNMVYFKLSSLAHIFYYAFLIINSFHLHIQLGLFDYLKGLF